ILRIYIHLLVYKDFIIHKFIQLNYQNEPSHYVSNYTFSSKYPRKKNHKKYFIFTCITINISENIKYNLDLNEYFHSRMLKDLTTSHKSGNKTAHKMIDKFGSILRRFKHYDVADIPGQVLGRDNKQFFYILIFYDHGIALRKKNLSSLEHIHSVFNLASYKLRPAEHLIGRTTLLPGVLKTICNNKNMPLPLKLFEISDVMFCDKTKDVGARNERRLCAVNYNKSSGFEVMKGLLDRVMQLLEVPIVQSEHGYYIKSCKDATYFEGRCAEIIYNNSVIGKIGVLHPEVLKEFELTNPCSCMEFSIEPFL
ncbi:phenylalanyl-tRNA synthetase beta chain, partial [Mytilus galloprovincialis]